jgi:hypothetical protein
LSASPSKSECSGIAKDSLCVFGTIPCAGIFYWKCVPLFRIQKLVFTN